MSTTGKNKQQTGPCQSYNRNPDYSPLKMNSEEFIQCGNSGKRRTDNTLDCGIHCDPCWDGLLECKKRSW